MFPILNPPPSSLPIPSLWVVPVHQPQASSIVHRTWTGNSFHIWYYTYFNAVLGFSCSLSCSFLLSLFDHSNPSDLLLLWMSIAEFNLSFNMMKCFVSLVVVVGFDLNWIINWRTRTTDVSLVVWWLTVCLLRWGTQVLSLVWELGSYMSQGDWVPMQQLLIPWPQLPKPVHLEPTLRNKRSHCNEKPEYCN